ncbi:MAG: SDR family NAD(P)-dependent oxidoreductase [Acidimicrobiales bacterium]|jgi:NAD(P)-dependent dehydrogenase (short-subunit alcohol dehydrogenase family)|nr:SDR family NAD(P)-dependent oxidoreductase [Acidimicrobiales bacterium]
MDELRFDDTTVVITGAGRGLGREYALLLAARGARVVVNDLGVAITDTGEGGEAPVTNPADDVVAEIVAAGGSAVANHDTIATPEGGEAIVAAAVETFGGVDVVVNNAGQVRLHPFADFPEEHVDTVIGTQLRGTLNVSRPAWRHMQAAGGGRIVNVASGAAFNSVPGGLVYGMAKMGVVGLTRQMAGEGAAVGISANVVAPYAKTRAGTGFGPIPWSDELGEWLHPRLVAPLVAWLAHPSCPVSGECFSVGGGHVARVSLVVNDGYVDREATIESIAEHLDAVMDGPTTEVTPTASPVMAAMLGGFRGPTT